MGQQQLLLVVLGIVIVGVAILIATNAYSEGSVKTNMDALLQDALRISSDAQAWKNKPAIFGGSPDHTKPDEADFEGASFYDFGYSSRYIKGDGACYENQNGEYAIFAKRQGLGILATNVPRQNMVGFWVSGTLEADIELHHAGWNPVQGGIGANGNPRTVSSHRLCDGSGSVELRDVEG